LFINYHLIIFLLKHFPPAHIVHLPAGWRANTHSGHRTEQAAGQLSRFYPKGPVVPKFAEYKPSGLSRVVCNVEGLPQAYNKAENNRRIQGSASGYLGQPATKTDLQCCERLIELSD